MVYGVNVNAAELDRVKSEAARSAQGQQQVSLDNAALQSEVASLRAQVDQGQAHQAALSRQIESVETQLGDKSARVEKAEKALSEKTASAESLSKQLATASFEVTKTKTELAVAMERAGHTRFFCFILIVFCIVSRRVCVLIKNFFCLCPASLPLPLSPFACRCSATEAKRYQDAIVREDKELKGNNNRADALRGTGGREHACRWCEWSLTSLLHQQKPYLALLAATHAR